MQFYGPSVTTVSKLIAPYLDTYTRLMQFEFGSEDMYLFHTNDSLGRNQSDSQWCAPAPPRTLKYMPPIPLRVRDALTLEPGARR